MDKTSTSTCFDSFCFLCRCPQAKKPLNPKSCCNPSSLPPFVRNTNTLSTEHFCFLKLSYEEGKEVGRLLSSVIFETQLPLLSIFHFVCYRINCAPWKDWPRSCQAQTSAWKGPPRPVVQVVHYTWMPSKRTNGGYISRRGGIFF